MTDFRTEFLSALAASAGSSTTGLFINSCYAHCQSETQETWLRSDSPVLADTVSTMISYWNCCPFSSLLILLLEILSADFCFILQTIAKAIGDWYFDRRPFKKIDCPYPCDKTCHNRIFEDHYEA